MNIIVCVKQVPDTFEVKIDPETKRIVREGVESVINPYDNYAIEEAVRMKERFGGKVTAVSMGPPQAEKALRESISMGVDEAFLLSDREFAGSDTLATSYILSCGIRKLKDFDVIVCGRETLDGSTGQVGPEIAYHLGIPYITYVSKVLDISSGEISCVRLMEDHYEELKSKMPVLITVIKEINQPRIPSLKGMLRAKKAEIATLRCCDMEGEKCNYGQDGSPTRVVDVWTEHIEKAGRKVEGETEELAVTLLNELKNLGVV
ncbi:MAG TPA: electron transfer flavoprotein subunit beta/FixA family protein [bacterium]|nr:electron transfer flavoprotein subunit beta/FixA family protein [bacterium]